MRVLHYALVLAVVMGASVATAQDSDKPKSDRLPWWKLADGDAPKDRPQPKAAAVPDGDKPGGRQIVRERPDAKRDDAKPADRPPAGKEGDAGQQQKRVYSYYYGSSSNVPKPEPRERLVRR